MNDLKRVTFESIVQKYNPYEHIYPLPAAPPELCRDAFLEQLLLPYRVSTSTETSSETSESSSDAGVKFASIDQVFDVENYLVRDKNITDLISIGRPSMRQTIFTFHADSVNIDKIMKGRFSEVVQAVGYISVILALSKMIQKLDINRCIWKQTENIDKNLRMFSWSIEDHFKRFQLLNKSYLDAIEHDVDNQMPCVKYRMDLEESTRLIRAILSDMERKRDLCRSSIPLIEDAQTDIETVMKATQKDVQIAHKRIVLALLKAPTSADPGNVKKLAAVAKTNYADFVYPIEVKHSIDWAQSRLEQCLLKSDMNIERKKTELKNIENEMRTSADIWESCEQSYKLQIADIKKRILRLDTSYEEALEICETEREIMNKKLSNVRAELQYKKEQIPMFHEKIEKIKKMEEQPEKQDGERSEVSSRSTSKRGTKTVLKKKTTGFKRKQ